MNQTFHFTRVYDSSTCEIEFQHDNVYTKVQHKNAIICRNFINYKFNGHRSMNTDYVHIQSIDQQFDIKEALQKYCIANVEFKKFNMFTCLSA